MLFKRIYIPYRIKKKIKLTFSYNKKPPYLYKY